MQTTMLFSYGLCTGLFCLCFHGYFIVSMKLKFKPNLTNGVNGGLFFFEKTNKLKSYKSRQISVFETYRYCSIYNSKVEAVMARCKNFLGAHATSYQVANYAFSLRALSEI